MSAVFLAASVIGSGIFAFAKDNAGYRCQIDPDPNPTYTSASVRVEFSISPLGWSCFWKEDDLEPELRHLPLWP